MGYRCELKTDKKIKVDDVQEVLDTLPTNLKGPLNNTRTNWGWSCGCDVYEPVSNILKVSGSYSISGKIAEEFIDKIKQGLKDRGYKVKTNWDY